jgi:hypothetical protein
MPGFFIDNHVAVRMGDGDLNYFSPAATSIFTTSELMRVVAHRQQSTVDSNGKVRLTHGAATLKEDLRLEFGLAKKDVQPTFGWLACGGKHLLPNAIFHSVAKKQHGGDNQ